MRETIGYGIVGLLLVILAIGITFVGIFAIVETGKAIIAFTPERIKDAVGILLIGAILVVILVNLPSVGRGFIDAMADDLRKREEK